MYFLGIGVLLLALKLLEVDPVATWSWLYVLAPFGLAALWWSWADASGYTKRKAMEKMDNIKAKRLQEQREALRHSMRGRR